MRNNLKYSTALPYSYDHTLNVENTPTSPTQSFIDLTSDSNITIENILNALPKKTVRAFKKPKYKGSKAAKRASRPKRARKVNAT